jgi:hypothetical protein
VVHSNPLSFSNDVSAQYFLPAQMNFRMGTLD